MDSPNPSKPIATQTSPAQESPIFSYISNLSPIQPVKAPAVTQGFLGLSSPPLVFTSPQQNFQSQPTHLKRPRALVLSTPQSFRQDDVACKESANSATGSLNLDQLTANQITCSYMVSDINTTEKDQSGFSTQCQDQFFTDVTNTVSVDLTSLPDPVIKNSECIDQLPVESEVKADYGHNTIIDEGIAICSPTPTKQIKDVLDKECTIDATEIETNIRHTDGISVQCAQIARKLSVGHTFIRQELEGPLYEEGRGSLDQSCLLLPGSMQNDVDNENSVEAIGAAMAEPSSKEAFQRRGVRRRCLQFEDAGCQAITNHRATNPESPHYIEKTPTLVHEKQAVMMQPAPYPRKTLGSTILVNKPIGLHLNKIFNSKQTPSGAPSNTNVVRMSKFCIRGQKLIPAINSPSDNSTSTSVLPLPTTALSKAVDTHVAEPDISAGTLSTCTIKPSNNSTHPNPVEEATSSNKRKFNTMTDAYSSDNFNQSNAKKRRKKSSDGNSCKSCSCKKSNCLKLYCDCFAAGQYCSDSCACQSCLNRPEYEETVLDKKHQIECRNPLAFAPKVIKDSVVPPTISIEDEQEDFTPSSARHKRGCNCKKSMCVKKYCECYQANVGCSDGCRCDGCQNVFGRKEEYGLAKDLQHDEDTGETTDDLLAEKFEEFTSGDGLHQSGLHNWHNLTPITPAFQFSNHRKDASEALSRSGKYFQASKPGGTFAQQFVMSPQSPSNTDGNGNISETADEVLDLDSLEQELDYGGIPNLRDWTEKTNTQPLPVNKQYSLPNSLRWHGSLNISRVLPTGTKVLPVSMQDDTADILEDAPASMNTVKVISPSKKRVSPPHRQAQEFGSSSSAVVKTGRKFILKAVPSFPPLTPCIKSTMATIVPTDDPRNCSNDK